MPGKNRDIQVKTQPVIKFAVGGEKMNTRPVVCGFGPAGFMAALCLAKAGFRPIVIEQGQSIDERMKSVEKFEKQGLLNTKSNIQFGEGGAGTFSDGKLTTRITDERCGFVTDTFIQNGAPAEIAKMAKPHIGTDLLVGVIKNIRKQIIALGGEVMFDTALTDIVIKNGRVVRVKTTAGEIPTDNLILATGHSAREVFYMLRDRGIDMQAKPFSVGVRIEHLQSKIDEGLYHGLAGHPGHCRRENISCPTQAESEGFIHFVCAPAAVLSPPPARKIPLW